LAAAVVAIPLAYAQESESDAINRALQSCISAGGSVRDCAHTVGVENFCTDPGRARLYGGPENCRQQYGVLFDAAMKLGAALYVLEQDLHSAGIVVKGQ
jgi:hypothetical protein